MQPDPHKTPATPTHIVTITAETHSDLLRALSYAQELVRQQIPGQQKTLRGDGWQLIHRQTP